MASKKRRSAQPAWRSKGGKGPQPEGEVRRSQVLTTYGAGATLDLVDDSILVGGLDVWRYEGYPGGAGVCTILEPRLADALAEKLPKDLRLNRSAPFRRPPDGDDQERRPDRGIQVWRFPDWFVCQNPRCRALVRADGLEAKGGRLHHECDRSMRFPVVPVRFVGACKNGHLEDFPWLAFVHEMQGKPRCRNPLLKLDEGATGDFSQIHVTCICGAVRPLSSALAEDVQLPCLGERPWLSRGKDAREECDQKLRLLVRTATNAYFSQVVSALTIPEPERRVENIVREHWGTLQAADSREDLATLRKIDVIQKALDGLSDDEVLRAVRAMQEGRGGERLPLRTAEFLQLVGQPEELPGELPAAEDTFFARRLPPRDNLPPGIAGVVLAQKLREVRVQVGFTRIEPVTPDLEGEFDLGVQTARLGLDTDWLPADEVLGEGVFLELDEAAVRAWEDRPEVRERSRELREGHRAWKAAMKSDLPFPGVRFYLLHSLSHLLLTAVSLECGYPASSIRERIYCSAPDGEVFMAGILLSTGSSGTEGTLGGLVDQGRRIGEHLAAALELGRLCSNDPVCAAHGPNDPAERFLEGAACHGCLYVAECSCERFNRYLDRSLVVPTLGNPDERAFFSG